MSSRSRRRVVPAVVYLALAVVLAIAAAPAAQGQPFGSWSLFEQSPAGWIQVPHHPSLNPTGQITIEGWVNLEGPTPPGAEDCRSILGKHWQQAWWVGSCNGQIRSYLRGASSSRTAGVIAAQGWTHFAVTFDGTTRRHYVNGELAGSWVEPGALTTSTSPVRIGSDVAWQFTPDGAINEVRLWSVARTQAQLRSTINVPLTAPQPGLVAVWANGGTNDVVGSHDGVIVGNVTGLTFPVAFGCSTTTTQLCLGNRFIVTVDWRADGPPVTQGQGRVAPLVTSESGIFWFFAPTNWEVMVKVLNACVLNDRFWAFSAATTNVFYRLEVFDVEAGVNKVYFNYPGPPAPAVTDTDAFATCP
jgi:hypothetical protein